MRARVCMRQPFDNRVQFTKREKCYVTSTSEIRVSFSVAVIKLFIFTVCWVNLSIPGEEEKCDTVVKNENKTSSSNCYYVEGQTLESTKV